MDIRRVTTYSIRQSLQGSLQDFLKESGFDDIKVADLVRETVSLLTAYKEEGASLYPEVYIFASLSGLRALAPTSGTLIIGTTRHSEHAAQTVLKETASLAIGGWAVYIVCTPSGFEYGVFRAKRHAFALSAEESLRDLGNSNPVLLIRNRGHLTVEALNGLNDTFTAALTPQKAELSQLTAATALFSKSLSAEVSNESEFEPYIRRLLTETIQRCHGTLAIVTRASARDDDPSLSDGVWTNPSIDLAAYLRAATETASADALADLQSAESILQGMINSDGVVVFDTRGKILAFRVFLRPGDHERALIPEFGGGRRRTFELMKHRLKTSLEAALFRSQDGETHCERSTR